MNPGSWIIEYIAYLKLRKFVRIKMKYIFEEIQEAYIKEIILSKKNSCVKSGIKYWIEITNDKIKYNEKLRFYFSNVFVEELNCIALYFNELERIMDDHSSFRMKNYYSYNPSHSEEQKQSDINLIDSLYKVTLVYYYKHLFKYKYSVNLLPHIS